MKKRQRINPALNAGSMADIAFLLLVFFLVATQIMDEEGIRVKLPPLETKNTTTNKLFIVKINKEGRLLIQKDLSAMEDLIPKTKAFLKEFQDKAVVSFQCDEETNYQDYIKTYSKLKQSYLEVWDEIAMASHGQAMLQLSKPLQDEIYKTYPLKISEADPF
ncbi:MAG: biopolymer transporter ExbD [Bacteroidota bacterium]